MVYPLASRATKQTRFFGRNPEGCDDVGALRCCSLLVWMTKRRISRLVLRPTPQRGA